MKRRAFFQSIAKAATIVALAPQLAFRVKPLTVTPVQEVATFWTQETRYSACLDDEYVKFMKQFREKEFWS